MTLVRAEGGEESFRRAAAALGKGGPELRKEVNKTLRASGTRVGRNVAITAGAELPRRGGFGYDVGGALAAVDASRSGGSIQTVSIRFKYKRWYLKRIDEQGIIKHPVFGRRPSVSQRVRPGAFRRPFEAAAPEIRADVIRAMETVAADVAARSVT